MRRLARSTTIDHDRIERIAEVKQNQNYGLTSITSLAALSNVATEQHDLIRPYTTLYAFYLNVIPFKRFTYKLTLFKLYYKLICLNKCSTSNLDNRLFAGYRQRVRFGDTANSPQPQAVTEECR